MWAENEQDVQVHRGYSPLVVSVPHAGTLIPVEMRDRMNPEVHDLPDTDWFVDRLYDQVPAAGASLVVTPWSRYVIDLNRPPDNAPLYANHAGSSLVPLETFAGHRIYREGEDPDAREVENRLQAYWQPYHDNLRSLIDAALERHGFAVLLDGHSIRSQVSNLFHGTLPHLNLGSADGLAASPELVGSVMSLLENSGLSAVRDQRFKGGFITRHYGRPQRQVHAIQLEIAQRSYMQEDPPRWDDGRASSFRELLQRLVDELQSWRPVKGQPS